MTPDLDTAKAEEMIRQRIRIVLQPAMLRAVLMQALDTRSGIDAAVRPLSEYLAHELQGIVEACVREARPTAAPIHEHEGSSCGAECTRYQIETAHEREETHRRPVFIYGGPNSREMEGELQPIQCPCATCAHQIFVDGVDLLCAEGMPRKTIGGLCSHWKSRKPSWSGR